MAENTGHMVGTAPNLERAWPKPQREPVLTRSKTSEYNLRNQRLALFRNLSYEFACTKTSNWLHYGQCYYHRISLPATPMGMTYKKSMLFRGLAYLSPSTASTVTQTTIMVEHKTDSHESTTSTSTSDRRSSPRVGKQSLLPSM